MDELMEVKNVKERFILRDGTQILIGEEFLNPINGEGSTMEMFIGDGFTAIINLSNISSREFEIFDNSIPSLKAIISEDKPYLMLRFAQEFMFELIFDITIYLINKKEDEIIKAIENELKIILIERTTNKVIGIKKMKFEEALFEELKKSLLLALKNQKKYSLKFKSYISNLTSYDIPFLWDKINTDSKIKKFADLNL